MVRLLIRFAVVAAAVYAAAYLVPGVEVREGLASLALVAGILGLVNATLGTVLRILSLPVRAATLGLFSIVINMAVLWATTRITDRIQVEDFAALFWASLVIAAVTMVLGWVLPDRD